MATYNNLEALQNHFDIVIGEVQKYACLVRAMEFQEESIQKLNELVSKIDSVKMENIIAQNEYGSNLCLSLSCITTALISEFKMILELKKDNPNNAWDHLINAQGSTRSAMQSHPNGAAHLESYVNRLWLYEKLLFPNQLFNSVGYLAHESSCSICDKEYGTCEHVKGKAYMGQMCAEIVRKATLQEVSIVVEPADKRCRATSFTENGINRDFMTWRAIMV